MLMSISPGSETATPAAPAPTDNLNLTALAERGVFPDFMVRWAIRRKLAAKLREETARGHDVSIDDMVAELDGQPIALATDKANEQHYELPSAYFSEALGPRRKYSCCYWPAGVENLEAAEVAALEQVLERADIGPGQRVLELGCGWGSFCLFAAATFPESEFVAVSNSRTQKAYIEAQAVERGLTNLRVVTADMNSFAPEERFDRVVSIEMFEHMKNYRQLMQRIASWLLSGGKLFVHIFVHHTFAYHFEDEGREDDWMAHYFFTGGTMPSDDLLLRFQEDLLVEGHWRVNGRHYARTLEAWLHRHDQAKSRILPLFEQTYGSETEARLWFQRWRMFYLACSELFNFRDGWQWHVSHYRFTRC
ncbi:MAG: cyclopropane-fatty-acyl-phospholipid synthase [Puniceicoccaceae bacterium 5H]|nr:MAG: cyclopropane-fatty-acyl-phospholipid synthase [Puniceicoccaceae bacterium 5H]